MYIGFEFKHLFNPEKFGNAWTEIILKAKPDYNVARIRWFHPWLSFPQTGMQDDGWFLRFQILLPYCGLKYLMRFQNETSVSSSVVWSKP